VGKGGTGTIFVNSKKTGEGKIDRTQPNIFSADEGADVGLDGETCVSDDYKQGSNRFAGKLQKVTIEVAPARLGAADAEDQEKARLARKAGE
jgi:arylsulfatase